jgi:hypothetical protein
MHLLLATLVAIAPLQSPKEAAHAAADRLLAASARSAVQSDEGKALRAGELASRSRAAR